MDLSALREKRKLLHEDMQWRKTYLEAMRASQNKMERDHITAKIGALAPGLQTLYLKQRLEKLKARII
jgi:TPP-dependent indolepyruvate ferredoxin oxidoreductase alpha subunit